MRGSENGGLPPTGVDMIPPVPRNGSISGLSSSCQGLISADANPPSHTRSGIALSVLDVASSANSSIPRLQGLERRARDRTQRSTLAAPSTPRSRSPSPIQRLQHLKRHTLRHNLPIAHSAGP